MLWRLFFRFRALFAIALLLVIWIVSTAESGNAETTALVLAGAVGIGSAFVAGIVKGQLGLSAVDGKRMVTFTYLLAAVLAFTALWLNGQLNFSDPAELAKTIGLAAALQQFTFNVLKDGRLGPYLKGDVPLLK